MTKLRKDLLVSLLVLVAVAGTSRFKRATEPGRTPAVPKVTSTEIGEQFLSSAESAARLQEWNRAAADSATAYIILEDAPGFPLPVLEAVRRFRKETANRAATDLVRSGERSYRVGDCLQALGAATCANSTLVSGEGSQILRARAEALAGRCYERTGDLYDAEIYLRSAIKAFPQGRRFFDVHLVRIRAAMRAHPELAGKPDPGPEVPFR